MKRNFLIIAFIIVALFNCKEKEIENEIEKEPNVLKISNGSYVGTFQCNEPSHSGLISNISMTFTSNRWEGTNLDEDTQHYPGLCMGSYSIKDSTIVFINECAWNTFLPWNHILSGGFYLKATDDKIEFYLSNEYYKEIYVLTKQK